MVETVDDFGKFLYSRVLNKTDEGGIEVGVVEQASPVEVGPGQNLSALSAAEQVAQVVTKLNRPVCVCVSGGGGGGQRQTKGKKESER